MSLAPARLAAIEVVRRVRERAAFAPAVLDSVLAKRSLSAEDAALATRLAYGTLQAEGTLDEAIDRFAARPHDIEPAVRDALRVAAYELLFAATPPRAAVHQGVEAVRLARPQAAGFANAILRKLADAASDFPWGDPASDHDALSRATAHPRWLVELLLHDVGETPAREMLAADNEPAPLFLAHNPFRGSFDALVERLTADGAEPQSCELPGCVRAGRPSAAVHSSAIHDGLALITDAAAQLAPLAVGGHPGEPVVEIASGRGTKTLALQALSVAAGAPAQLYAVDVHDFKARVLAERMSELGVPGVTPLVGDATRLAEVPGLPALGSAAAVLVDAPCSGTGTLRRRPEKRWRLRPEDIETLARLQFALLTEAASLVRPGGVLVYSTCTVTRAENQDVVSAFLASAPGKNFQTHALSETVPAAWQRFVTQEGWFAAVPGRDGMDGHFVARLVRP